MISLRSIVGTVASAETGGTKGSIISHWASVRSDGYRFRWIGSHISGTFLSTWAFGWALLSFSYRLIVPVRTVSHMWKRYPHTERKLLANYQKLSFCMLNPERARQAI